MKTEKLLALLNTSSQLADSFEFVVIQEKPYWTLPLFKLKDGATLSRDYSLKTDWPVFSWSSPRLRPSFWLRNEVYRESVRVVLNPSTSTFKAIDKGTF